DALGLMDPRCGRSPVSDAGTTMSIPVKKTAREDDLQSNGANRGSAWWERERNGPEHVLSVEPFAWRIAECPGRTVDLHPPDPLGDPAPAPLPEPQPQSEPRGVAPDPASVAHAGLLPSPYLSRAASRDTKPSRTPPLTAPRGRSRGMPYPPPPAELRMTSSP